MAHLTGKCSYAHAPHIPCNPLHIQRISVLQLHGANLFFFFAFCFRMPPDPFITLSHDIASPHTRYTANHSRLAHVAVSSSSMLIFLA